MNMLLAICAAGMILVGQGGAGREGTLKLGDKAPDFSLRFLNEDKEFKLSSNLDKVPTVLIFGSYT